MENHINEKTHVGLYGVLGAIPVIVWVVFFVANIYYKASASETRLDRQAEVIKEQRLMLIEIKERTARIEALVAILAERK